MPFMDCRALQLFCKCMPHNSYSIRDADAQNDYLVDPLNAREGNWLGTRSTISLVLE